MNQSQPATPPLGNVKPTPPKGFKFWARSNRQQTDQMYLQITNDLQRSLRLEEAPDARTSEGQSFRLVKDGQSAYVIRKSKEFIYEAMHRLQWRGIKFYFLAAMTSAVALRILVSAYFYLMEHQPSELTTTLRGVQITGPIQAELPYLFTLRLLSSLSVVGLYFIGLKLCLTLGKAFMHEGVKNFERRHALRFGWLYMELKGKDWDFLELQEAFQWNREATSAFRDMDVKHVSETTINTLLARLNSMSQSAETKFAEKLGERAGS